jgi:hypothetical protein
MTSAYYSTIFRTPAADVWKIVRDFFRRRMGCGRRYAVAPVRARFGADPAALALISGDFNSSGPSYGCCNRTAHLA